MCTDLLPSQLDHKTRWITVSHVITSSFPMKSTPEIGESWKPTKLAKTKLSSSACQPTTCFDSAEVCSANKCTANSSQCRLLQSKHLQSQSMLPAWCASLCSVNELLCLQMTRDHTLNRLHREAVYLTWFHLLVNCTVTLYIMQASSCCTCPKHALPCS